MDATSETTVQEVIRRENRSLLSYIGEAFPWTASESDPRLGELKRIVRAEGAALAALGRFLLRTRGTIPYLGSYPMSFTTSNFIALEHLVPRLLTAQRQAIADLEAALARVGDVQAREQLVNLLVVKRKTLDVLETLSAQPATV